MDLRPTVAISAGLFVDTLVCVSLRVFIRAVGISLGGTVALF